MQLAIWNILFDDDFTLDGGNFVASRHHRCWRALQGQ